MTNDDTKQCNAMYSCLYVTTNKLHRIINKMAEEEFVKTGLSPSYAVALSLIINEPGLSQNEISKKLNIKPSTTSRFMDKLESKGLVSRKVKGKVSYLYSTPKGEKLQQDIAECWESLHRRYSEILGYEEGDQLTSAVYSAANELEKDL